MPRLRTLIEAETCRGKGVEGDPVRGVMQYWTTDGEWVANGPDPYLSKQREGLLEDLLLMISEAPTPLILVNSERAAELKGRIHECLKQKSAQQFS